MESTAGERNWTGFVVPTFVTLLLGIQFFLGFRGFDRPDGGLLGLLEAPGALLGWGGVAILAVLLGWLIAGLVGRDLFGLQGASGLVVRLVGCVALGLALSGLVGLLGGRTAGGEVGAGIGSLLGDSLGPVAAILILVLMAIPALVLSVSPFFTTGPRTGQPGAAVSMDALSELEPKPGLYEGTTTHQPKPLYPERRFDEEGHEIPMSFDARDVGQVRYADEGPDPAELARPLKPDPVPVHENDLADGVRFADDEPEAEGPLKPDAVDADDGRIPLADGVRYVDESEAEPAANAAGSEQGPEGRVERTAPSEDLEDEEGEEESVEAEAEEEEEDVEVAAPPTRPQRPAVPAVAPSPVSSPPPPQVRGADALDQLQDEDEGARYRAKLEGSGIFDEAPIPEPAAAASEPAEDARPKPKARKKPAAKKKAASKKKAAPKKKKAPATARKKAAPKKKKAPAASKRKAAPAKKTPAVQKKAAAAPKKKAAPRKKPVPDPEPPAEAPIEEPRRKGAGATHPGDEIYRKAVAVAMERSAASSVLLSRRLGIGYAQARALIELLVKDGVLGEMAPSGSRPLLISEEEWAERSGHS